MHIRIGGIRSAGSRNHAEAHTVCIGLAELHRQLLVLQLINRLGRTHHQRIVNERTAIRKFHYERHVAHFAPIQLFEVYLGLQSQIIACHYAALVHGESRIVAGVVQLALIEERYNHVVHCNNLSALHGDGVLHIVGAHVQAHLLKSAQLVNRIEEIALSHGDQSIVTVGEVVDLQCSRRIVVLLHQVSVGIIQDSHHVAVLRLSEGSHHAAELHDGQSSFHAQFFVNRCFSHHIPEHTVFARSGNLQHVAHVYFFQQHDFRILHTELCHRLLLCLVIDGVSHIVVVAVEVLRFRLLARLHAGRISKVQVDGRTRNGFECNIFQLYLLECQHTVGQFHGVAHVFCFRNGNLCRSGKHLELETSLAVCLGRKGLVIPAVQRLRNRNSGTGNRFLALQVYHPTLQL